MSPLSVGILLGILSQVLVNVGMGVQKQGSEVLARPSRAFSTSRDRRHLATWLFGTAMTTGAVLIQFKALELAPASVVASFAGLGLACLVLYSRAVLHEPLGQVERRALALIILGTALAGYFGPGPEARAPVRLGALALYGLSLATLAGLGTGWILARRKAAGGAALALASGVLGGLAVMVQKAVSMRALVGGPDLSVQAARMAHDPLLWLFVFLTTAAFVVMQLSFRFDRAVVIVPAYTVASMLAPVMGSPAAFGEELTPALVAGLALLVCGVLLLTRGTGPGLSDPLPAA